jgi:hypothetical protein
MANNIQPIDGSLTGADLTAAINDRLRRIAATSSATGATGARGAPGAPGSSGTTGTYQVQR